MTNRVLLKIAATLHLAIYSCLPHYSMEFSKGLVITSASSASESPMIVQPQEKSLFVQKTSPTKDIKINKFPKILGSSITPFSKVNAERKVRSYFLVNDIQSNLPLIQYKFPLSEHTEAG